LQYYFHRKDTAASPFYLRIEPKKIAQNGISMDFEGRNLRADFDGISNEFVFAVELVSTNLGLVQLHGRVSKKKRIHQQALKFQTWCCGDYNIAIRQSTFTINSQRNRFWLL
jgi:hypothetical protein